MSLTLQPLLRLRYRRETWTTLLLDLFPDGAVSVLSTPAEIGVTHEQVVTTRQLGHIRLADGSRIALVEVEAKSTVKLARNRIALRNFIGQLIVPGSSDAVLAVFHQPGKEDWRLTYASRRTTLDPETFAVTHSETAPRRFTFLLGPGETCRTAAGRLKELEGKEKLTLDDIERAFSVERLNKDFFKRYREFYERFTTHLLSSEKAVATRAAFGIAVLADAKEQEKADKPVRDFAKKLLGRLVFLHFLQKKRWLGCPAGSTDWTGGEADFIAAFFEKAKAAGEGDRFHSNYLTPLFFQALNTPDRKGDLFSLTKSRLPYLNGGLFEEDAPALRSLDFPPLLFEELLGFFAEYHFTIDENDPEDHEVGIDPEMLGHIFENLLEDNKDKGAFYTPKAIVQYMARESLRHYLETHLGPDPEIGILLAEKDLTRLAKDGFVRQHAKKIATLLEDVKICDPAIGSGAFPIGLLQEILWTRLTLNWELNTPEDRARLKREIIRNSVHGVDLDPGAVEIARLRFWLALVVDEETPRPLPNLDYKIMQGDALLESFEGIDLSRISTGQQASFAITQVLGGQSEFALDDAKAQMELQVSERGEKIAALLRDYFSEKDPVEKKRRHATIDAEVLKHLDHAIAWERERIEALLDQQQKMLSRKIARTKSWTEAKAKKLIAAHQGELAALKEKATKLHSLQASTERPFFLWHLYFQEVFENGGFDIVIANPPYVSAIEHKKVAGEAYRNAIKRRFSVASGAWDLYIPFFQLGATILKQGGTLCLICPNKYLSASYAVGLREFIHSTLSFRTLANVSRVEVFETAAVYPVITVLSNQVAKDEPPLIVRAPAGGLSRPDHIWSYSSNSFELSVLRLLPDLIWGFLLSPTVDLLTRVLGRCVSLDRIAEVNATTTASEADEYGAKLTENATRSWRVVNTGTIDPFRNFWGARRLTHQRQTFENPTLERDAGIVGAKRTQLYNSPKLIFAKMALRFEGFVDIDGSYAGLNSNCVHSPREGWDLHSLAALLHSKSVQYLYAQYFDALRMAGGYLPFQAPQARVIPIPPATDDEKARLTTLAERAAEFAKSGATEALRATEREIDGIVHQLFHLTPAEIALIEEALP